MLNYLGLIYKKSTFFGYDKNVFFNKIFPKKKNFIFFNKNFNKIRSKFDIIVLSHSLFYFKNLNLFLKDLLKKITENGKIFIVIPNISKNPFYSLMGDQKVIFTKKNITNLFKLNNFKLIEINQKLLKNEHIFIGSKTKKTRFNKFSKDYTFEKSLKKIIKFKKKIQNFKIKRPIIIGTKVVAATLDEFFKKKTTLFFDMNINQKIKIFRNKPVLILKKQKKLISVITSFNIPKNEKKLFQNNFNIKIKDYGF